MEEARKAVYKVRYRMIVLTSVSVCLYVCMRMSVAVGVGGGAVIAQGDGRRSSACPLPHPRDPRQVWIE